MKAAETDRRNNNKPSDAEVFCARGLAVLPVHSPGQKGYSYITDQTLEMTEQAKINISFF